MKKILFTFVICCFACPVFAQIPFVSHQSVFAEPVRVTPPTNIGHYNPMDPLGLGTRKTTSKSSNVQKNKTNYNGSWYKAIGICFNNGEWEDTNLKILIGDDMITIFAKETHTLRVGEMYDEGRLDESSYYTSYKCVDDENKNCLLDILTMDDAIMLNIEYPNFSVKYGIIPDE